MKKLFTILFLLVALISNAQRTMFGSQNNYAAPAIASNLVALGLIQNLDANNNNSYGGTGTTWYDLAGSNNGAIAGAAFTTTGNVSYFNFTSKVAASYITAPITKTTSMTFNVWAKVSALNSYSCMLFNAGPDGRGPDMFFYNAKCFWNVWDSEVSPFLNASSGYVNTATMIPDINWHNYTVVVDANANNTKLYFDGVFVGTAVYWSPIKNDNTTLYIGGAGANDYGWSWLGGIASFQSYNRALTAAEVTTNFNALKSRFGF